MPAYLIFKSEKEAIAAESIVSKNCKWPNKLTINWSDIIQIKAKFGFVMPPNPGSHGFPYDQMMAAITGYEIIEYTPVNKEDI